MKGTSLETEVCSYTSKHLTKFFFFSIQVFDCRLEWTFAAPLRPSVKHCTSHSRMTRAILIKKNRSTSNYVISDTFRLWQFGKQRTVSPNAKNLSLFMRSCECAFLKWNIPEDSVFCSLYTSGTEKLSETVSTKVMQTPEFNRNQHICIFWIWNVFLLFSFFFFFFFWCRPRFLSLRFDVAHTYWRPRWRKLNHAN